MSFHDFTRSIFEFLLKLAHMSLLKVFMQYLRFLDFYMSNDPKLELELRKLAEFRLVRFFGSADGPRVRGGQSAVNGTCSPEALQRSSQPQKYTADGPPKDRGRSSRGCAEFNKGSISRAAV